MVIGIALFSWDKKVGAVLEIKHPENLDLSQNLINKIYMTHAYRQENQKEELMEINLENQIILSYCDMSKVVKLGYEIIILIVHEKEKIHLKNLKSELFEFAREVLNKPKIERKKYFFENLDLFFKETVKKKILLVGRAATGKSSIKQVIFEGKMPQELLSNPLEPTRGLTPSVYSWLDLDLGIFDSAGQELDYLLDDKNEQTLAFENTDIVIYMFDYLTWIENNEIIIKDIKKVSRIIKQESYYAKVVLFLHKIDLIKEENREQNIKNIQREIKEQLNLQIYFTSLYPNLIYNTYNAFYVILSNFSKETIYFKEVLDEKIKDNSKSMCFITNQNSSIVVQTMSNDFNFKLINQIHRLIAQFDQSFEDMSINDNIDYMILSSLKNFNIIMKFLNLSNYDLKNLILISETISINQLIEFCEEIKNTLNRYFYKDIQQ